MSIQIGDRRVGLGEPCWIVAELGLNHCGSLSLAYQMVRAAKQAGADAVKVQCFSAACFATARATWQGESQAEMFRRYELPREAFAAIAEECRRLGLVFFGTPDCPEHAEWLIEAGAQVLKVGSDDLTNTPLLRRLAQYGKPMILSTGMAENGDVEAALSAVRDVPVAVLYCCSVYPAALSQLRLRQVGRLGGFSDHTVGSTAAAVAVALGATIIEKHFTMDHGLPGPDHRWSADPQEFAALVGTIRALEAALRDDPMDQAEVAMRAVARRSIVASHALQAGEILGDPDVALKRPGDGLPPSQLGAVLGKRLRRDFAADEQIRAEDLE